MLLRRIAFSAAVAAGLAALPLAAAKAQYCSFPLEWPFCVAGAAVNTAGAIATAPFAAVAGPPYYYYRPAYYGPGWRHRRWCAHHPYRCGWR